MAPQTLPVLIAGAGPTGLVAALTLRQNGIPVRIIDKVPEPPFGSRGAGIQPRTLEVYKLLGVLPDILKHGTPTPPFHIYNYPEGKEIIKEFFLSPRSYPTPGMPFYNPMLLGQDIACGILRSHLSKYDCHVEFGTELRALEQHDDHVVAHIVRAGGPNGSEETFSASYVIGSDGARGAVRKLLGLQFDGVTRDDAGIILGDLRATNLPRDCWAGWGPNGKPIFSVLPRYSHDDDTFWVTLMAFDKDVDYDRLVRHPEEFKAVVQKITGRPDIEIIEFLSLAFIRFNIRMVKEFQRGRVFVAGDAAHVHSPAGGQGLNSSVMDAFNLAWKISLVHKGAASPTLFASYTAERAPVIEKMLKLSTETLDKTVGNDDDGWKRGTRFYQLDTNYRGSPIALEGRGEDVPAPPANMYTFGDLGRVRAGDRAPDAPNLLDLKDPAAAGLARFYDLFTPTKHTVLIFSDRAAAADEVVSALGGYPAGLVQSVAVLPAMTSVREGLVLPKADFVVKDTDRHAYEGYSADHTKAEPAVVVVRPDSFVGATGRGVATVKEYFSRIFA